jgi:hypothetical protein
MVGFAPLKPAEFVVIRVALVVGTEAAPPVTAGRPIAVFVGGRRVATFAALRKPVTAAAPARGAGGTVRLVDGHVTDPDFGAWAAGPPPPRPAGAGRRTGRLAQPRDLRLEVADGSGGVAVVLVLERARPVAGQAGSAPGGDGRRMSELVVAHDGIEIGPNA